MIKINLATRKQAVSSGGAEGGRGGGGNGFDSFLGAFKSNANLDGIKELPLRKIVVSILLCIAVTYLLSSYKEDEMAKAETLLARLAADQTKLKAELGKSKGYENVKKSLEADELMLTTKINTIQKLLAARQDTPKMLTSLSNLMPQSVWLNSLKISEKEILFKGESVGFNSISDFMKGLNESAYFSEVHLQGTQAEKESTSDLASFELQAKKR